MQIFRATADLDRCVELVRSSKNRVTSKVNVFSIERGRTLHMMSCNMMIGFCVTAYIRVQKCFMVPGGGVNGAHI